MIRRVYWKSGERRNWSRCCGIPGRLGVATPPDEVEQPRNSLHDKVTEALLDIAKNCGDNVKDLDAANGVFNGDPLGTDLAVLFLLFGGPLFAPGLLGGLLNGCAFGSIALEALVLITPYCRPGRYSAPHRRKPCRVCCQVGLPPSPAPHR